MFKKLDLPTIYHIKMALPYIYQRWSYHISHQNPRPPFNTSPTFSTSHSTIAISTPSENTQLKSLSPNPIKQLIWEMVIIPSISSALLLKSWNTCTQNLTQFLFHPTNIAFVLTTPQYSPSYFLHII